MLSFEYGGYPEAVLYKKEREKILRDIFDTAIYREVIERAKVRNVKAMKLLINALYNYFEHLNDAFFVFPLRKFDLSYIKKSNGHHALKGVV